MRPVSFRRADPADASVRELLDQLDRYQSALYPAESNHLLSVDELGQPNVTFLTAVVGDRLDGCGAFVNLGGEYAEIKRMFVLPAFRGLKIGGRLLAELEAVARSAGLSIARLETGVSQPEAIRLYEQAGYARRGPFGSYAEDPLSLFMEKRLA